MKHKLLILLIIGLWSCEEIINEPNITNETVWLLAPVDDTRVNKDETISFNWEYLNGATDYHLQVATPTFYQAAQIQLDTVINSNQFSIDSLDINNYQWRVKGLNSAYETGYSTNGFVVE